MTKKEAQGGPCNPLFGRKVFHSGTHPKSDGEGRGDGVAKKGKVVAVQAGREAEKKGR